MEKHFIVYQTTNLVNGMTYIGVHTSANLHDRYLGSGTKLLEDFKRFGRKKFRREILLKTQTYEAMKEWERILVDDEFVNREDTYNVMLGGSAAQKVPDSERGDKPFNFIIRGMPDELRDAFKHLSVDRKMSMNALILEAMANYLAGKGEGK